jgi:hypothetical protein
MIRAGGDMRRIVLILAILVAVTACKKSEMATSTTTTTTTQSTATTATTATVAPAPQPRQTTATTATTASAPPTAGVIASAEGEISGARMEVTELKRASGGTVNLKLVLINNGDKNFPMYGYNLGDKEVNTDYKSVGGIHLVDPVNKKKYFVIRDSEKKCMCSNDVDDVRPGARTNLWAKYPAPPPDVTKITIEIPHFQPMDDVPISQ